MNLAVNRVALVSSLVTAWCVAASPAHGDLCALVDRATAVRAAERIENAETYAYESWLDPVEVGSVTVEADGNLHRVVVDGNSLDLAYVLLPRDQESFESLGWWLGDCGATSVPRIVPRRPLQPATRSTVDAPTAGGLIGLLEIPSLLGGFSAAGWREPTGARVEVRRAPSSDSPVIARISDAEELELREYGYESSGAVVLEADGAWFRIALRPEGSGWIRSSDGGSFHALQDLLSENLAYLSEAWDGVVWNVPAAPAGAQRLSPVWRSHLGDQLPVEVVGHREVDGVLWLELSLLESSPCAADRPDPFAGGWVPALAASGAPQVWFYSRGC